MPPEVTALKLVFSAKDMQRLYVGKACVSQIDLTICHLFST